MLRTIRICTAPILGTILFLACTRPTYANPSIGVAAWGGYPTVTIGLTTLGIGSLLVIAIETWVIHQLISGEESTQ